MAPSLTSRFEIAARAIGLPPYETEYRFHATRKWRFDYAWPSVKVAVEIEGGIWLKGKGKKSRHTTGVGYSKDCEKYNHAAALDWAVIRLTSLNLEKSVEWVEFIRDLIKKRE